MLVITLLSTAHYAYFHPTLQSTIHEKSCKVTTFFLYDQTFLLFFTKNINYHKTTRA